MAKFPAEGVGEAIPLGYGENGIDKAVGTVGVRGAGAGDGVGVGFSGSAFELPPKSNRKLILWELPRSPKGI